MYREFRNDHSLTGLFPDRVILFGKIPEKKLRTPHHPELVCVSLRHAEKSGIRMQIAV